MSAQVAESSTHGALKGLRYACQTWQHEERPTEIGEWRHVATFLLRRDLDIRGFESFDPKERGPLLKTLQDEICSLERQDGKRIVPY